MNELPLSPGTLAALACSLEVAAPKPGNVHRGADFENLTLEDFLVSAHVLGQAIDQYQAAGLGATILTAVQRTQVLVGSNTNLGLALLLVPLAKAIPCSEVQTRFTPSQTRPLSARQTQTVTTQEVKFSDESGVQASTLLDATRLRPVLTGLTMQDATCVYQAIRLANPGGLGQVEQGDLNDPMLPELPLLEAMALAADRDLVARQYQNGFQDIFATGVELLAQGARQFHRLSQAIVYAHVGWMAEFPDSLIARKCGTSEAHRSQDLARAVFAALHACTDMSEPPILSKLSELDFWLRAKGNQRNPGTTADLIAASLFVAIYNRQIHPPFR